MENILKHQLISDKGHKYLLLEKALLEKSNFIANLAAINPDLLNSFLQKIETAIAKENHSFNQIIKICYEIVKRIPIPTVEVDVPYVIRCRPNENKVAFENISQLSYNPNIEEISFGRFNYKKEPIFYAVSPSDTIKNFPPEIAAIFETCKDLKKNPLAYDERHITLSYWKIEKPFYVIVLSLFGEGPQKNRTLLELSESFKTNFKTSFTYESQMVMQTFFNFLSNKAASTHENNKNYLITTAFRHAIEKYYGKQIRGVLYSSVETEHNCLNIAITKDTIDSEYLRFFGASVYEIKNGTNIQQITYYASPNENGAISFQYLNSK